MVKRDLGRQLLNTPAIPPGASEAPDGTLPAAGAQPPTDPPPGSFWEAQVNFGTETPTNQWVDLTAGLLSGSMTPADPAVIGSIAQDLVSSATDLAVDSTALDIAALSSLTEYESAAQAATEPVDFTNWEERTRLLDDREKNILAAATANMDLSAITGEELDLRLRQVGLDKDEAANMLGRVGLARAGLGIEQERIDLDAAGVGEAIDFLTQTLGDVDLDEASLNRNLATIADQISMTDLQKSEIGYQKEDVGALDEITKSLLAARETLLGEESGVGQERISLERQQIDLEEEATELQADRAMKAALRDAYARGASFTTGLREDVTDLDRSRELALDELALRNTGLDLASRELLARTGFQSEELEAARQRADIDLDQNLRALDMDFAEVEFMADRLGRSAADVTDAITRLDTERLGIQLEISDQTRRLSELGLDSEDIANQLAGLDYDAADIQLTLDALELQEKGIGLDRRTLAADELLQQLAVERQIDEIDLQRIGFTEEQAKAEAAHEEWRKVTDAKQSYRADQMEQAAARGGIAASLAAQQAIEQWAPVLAGMSQADAEQITSAFDLFDEVAYPGATSDLGSAYIPGVGDIFINADIDFPDPEGMYPSPEIPGGGYVPPAGPGEEEEDDGFVPDFPGDVPPVPPAGPGEEEEPESSLPPSFEPDEEPESSLPPSFEPDEDEVFVPDFDPELFEEFDFDEAFDGLFGAAPGPSSYTMDPGQRRTTSDRLSNQINQSPDFATALLNQLGAPVLANNLETIGDWIVAEGTTAAFNPLATTKQGGNPGDANRDQYDSFNSVGVKNYPDFATGVDRTAATLRDSFALPVLEGLMANIPASVMNTDHLVNQALSTWSGGGYTEFPDVATPGPAYGPPR